MNARDMTTLKPSTVLFKYWKKEKRVTSRRCMVNERNMTALTKLFSLLVLVF